MTVDDHFAKALGETWLKLQSETKEKEANTDSQPGSPLPSSAQRQGLLLTWKSISKLLHWSKTLRSRCKQSSKGKKNHFLEKKNEAVPSFDYLLDNSFFFQLFRRVVYFTFIRFMLYVTNKKKRYLSIWDLFSSFSVGIPIIFFCNFGFFDRDIFLDISL